MWAAECFQTVESVTDTPGRAISSALMSSADRSARRTDTHSCTRMNITNTDTYNVVNEHGAGQRGVLGHDIPDSADCSHRFMISILTLSLARNLGLMIHDPLTFSDHVASRSCSKISSTCCPTASSTAIFLDYVAYVCATADSAVHLSCFWDNGV